VSDDNAWRPPRAASPPPEEIQGYADLVEIGRGGDSVVYKARDLAVERDVAIKVLSVDDPVRADRFVREIEITVELGRQHPNIVTVLAIGTTARGRPAIVMDYVERGSLHDQLRTRGPLAVDEAVAVGAVVADALSFAHAHGVLHRDVKPQNILVLPTSWVLADFGIARLIDTEHTASVETFTYRHASPQLLDGLPPTASDDIWALGSTLFTLLDGRPPFSSDDPDDDSALAYLRRVRTEKTREAAHHDGQGDTAQVMAVVERCLAKDIGERFASAAELCDALAEVQVHGWEPGAPVMPLTPASTPAVEEAPQLAEHAVSAQADAVGRATATVEPTAPAGTTAPAVSLAQPAPVLAEPEPVALSVLAHGATQEDAEPTGSRPAGLELDGGGVAAPPRHREPAGLEPGSGKDRPGRTRRRVLLILGAAALLIGATLGLIGSVLRDDDTEGNAGTTPTGASDEGEPIPTLSAEPTDTGPPQANVENPDLAFDFLDLSSDGVTLKLDWNDPSDGEGRFVLSEVSPERNLLKQFAPGTTHGEIAFPLSVGNRACFALVVVMPTGEYGVASPRPRCVTLKG
jgi:tRNA A-37 threonylcarbamoyl transferase component Bud32